MFFIAVEEEETSYKISYYKTNAEKIPLPTHVYKFTTLNKCDVGPNNQVMHRIFFRMSDKEVYVPNRNTVSALSKIFNDSEYDFEKAGNIVVFDEYIEWCDENINEYDGLCEKVERIRASKYKYRNFLSGAIELYNQLNKWIPEYKDSRVEVKHGECDVDSNIYYLVDVDGPGAVEHLCIKDDYERMDNEYLVLFVNNEDIFSYESIKAMLKFDANLKFEDYQNVGFEAKLNAFLLNDACEESRYVVFTKNVSVLKNLKYIKEKTNLDIEVASINKLSSREVEELDLFKEFDSFIMFDDDEEDM